MNQTFCGWVGRDAGEIVGRMRFADFLTVGARIFHQTHFAPLLRMRNTVSEVKLGVQAKDGTSLPMMVNARRHAVDGVIIHDISTFVARDRDKYEKELVLARTRLEVAIADANRLRDQAEDRALLAEQMIGIVSHDLRNPISTITMGTSVLRADAAEGQGPTLERMSRASARAGRLIDDLLDFTAARLGRGLRATFEEIDLHIVTAHVVEELVLADPAHRLRHVRLGQGTCTGDPHRLAQMVGNLVANATAYGEVGGVVTVTSEIASDSAALSVHNTGRVLSLEARELIFEPMMRGTDGGAPRSVGLGLFIVSEIARIHGGAADVVSTADGGTTFQVSFPRQGLASFRAGGERD